MKNEPARNIISSFSGKKITVIDLPKVGDDGVLYLIYICTKYRGTLKMYDVCKAFCWDSSENEWEYLGVYDEYEELLLSKIKRLERCSNKGKWTEVDRDVMGMKTFQCSNCGGKAYGYSEPNFCSHCGADMRKEDEEE